MTSTLSYHSRRLNTDQLHSRAFNDYPTGRFLRDAKLMEIGAGTSEIRRWLIGRELFGETK